MAKPYFAKAPGEEWKIPMGDAKEARRTWEDGALTSDCLHHVKPQKQGCGYAGSMCLYGDKDSLSFSAGNRECRREGMLTVAGLTTSPWKN